METWKLDALIPLPIHHSVFYVESFQNLYRRQFLISVRLMASEQSVVVRPSVDQFFFQLGFGQIRFSESLEVVPRYFCQNQNASRNETRLVPSNDAALLPEE